MPIKLIKDQLWSELKNSPATLIVICGLIGFCYWSFYNQARAESVEKVQLEVSEVKVSVDRILSIQLTEIIQSLRVQWCEETDVMRKQSIAKTLNNMQEDYKKLNKEFLKLEPCSTLLSRRNQ